MHSVGDSCLRHVISYLDSWDLLDGTLFVCKQWYVVGREHFWNAVSIDDDFQSGRSCTSIWVGELGEQNSGVGFLHTHSEEMKLVEDLCIRTREYAEWFQYINRHTFPKVKKLALEIEADDEEALSEQFVQFIRSMDTDVITKLALHTSKSLPVDRCLWHRFLNELQRMPQLQDLVLLISEAEHDHPQVTDDELKFPRICGLHRLVIDSCCKHLAPPEVHLSCFSGGRLKILTLEGITVTCSSLEVLLAESSSTLQSLSLVNVGWSSGTSEEEDIELVCQQIASCAVLYELTVRFNNGAGQSRFFDKLAKSFQESHKLSVSLLRIGQFSSRVHFPHMELLQHEYKVEIYTDDQQSAQQWLGMIGPLTSQVEFLTSPVED
eukprot:TRINITY_DN5923_c0_g1_i1.p1 TRINITY_DN5923_c0_g1~~TRINITY_DN5923_c0_g1_i1.p1  ORF type:complete len:379 (-),score=83.85 TRINITY_DN5923_c0_g1_i1:28-1164(-)